MSDILWPTEEATTGAPLVGANSIELKSAGTFLHGPFEAAWGPRVSEATMELWMNPDPSCEVFSSTMERLFCPLVYVTDPGATKLVWALGLLANPPVTIYNARPNVRMVLLSDTAHAAVPYGPDIALVADHWRHVAAVWKDGAVTQWGERKIGTTVAFDTGGYEVPDGAQMFVGGTRMPIPGSIAGARLVPFVGKVDEARFTLAARYVPTPPANIPEAQLKLPWPSRGP